ncbi:hypothetical protein [Dubosiella newyorkensis]|jgi:hypothetical protein|uniref:hypothetical protein n=1 Tax=Dubosiella newyorkensis TaxID=1862672 RepID=UPI002353C934|nr:hypothetical protein [Dubosiella newyorkensis]MCI9042041.1 hypothetical protein [Dubosiella newyorkensis]
MSAKGPWLLGCLWLVLSFLMFAIDNKVLGSVWLGASILELIIGWRKENKEKDLE